MSSISTRYKEVLEHIRAQEQHCGRLPGSVALLAVSKTHLPDALLQAYDAGARDFGENYVQEALDKIQALAGTPDIRWHFIGPIQSNKTRDIARTFQWVHSVDRLKIARRLHDQRPAELPPLNVCVQVNLSGEDSKSGVNLPDAASLCQAINELDRLRLRGLMAIPAPGNDYDTQRKVFRSLATQFRALQKRFPPMDTLSIGMSNDFEAAIAEGSTMIRIGTAIFGKRPARPAT